MKIPVMKNDRDFLFYDRITNPLQKSADCKSALAGFIIAEFSVS